MPGLRDKINQLPSIPEIVREFELNAKKSLGQNFLFSDDITGNIVRYAGDLAESLVIEIGPGPGGLTRSILRAEPKKLVAVEKDHRCLAALKQLQDVVGDERFEVVAADALKLSLAEIGAGESMKIIANLPYNIATPLLIGWLRQLQYVESMTLMFQKEVAQRIAASPGNKSFGRLSILSQWLCDCVKVMDIPPGAFSPPPKVTSSVVHFRPKHQHVDSELFSKIEQLTACAFGQRRKKIRSSLKNICDEQMLQAAGIDPNLRAENLTVEQFVALAGQL